MRSITGILLACLLTFAPAALAQDEPTSDQTEPASRPDDAAWVDDCPPDMMCAASSDNSSETIDPCPQGGDECAYASGPSTCVDGDDGTQMCRDDVQYFGGEPTRGPEDGSCENCRGDVLEQGEPISAPADRSPTGDATKSVPGPALGLVLAALAGALVLLRRK